MGELAFSWDSILNLLRTFRIWDFLDIVIIAYLLYKVLMFASNTRAGQLIKGIALLFVMYLIAATLELKSTSYLLEQVFSFGIIAIVVVFQPELRHALESMGKSRISNLTFFNFNNEKVDDETLMKNCITKIVDGVTELSKHDVGALIVFERETKLGEIISTGTIINAEPSKEIIGNIFFHNAPLHDGATIIRGGRVYAAGCFLPLSQELNLPKELGSRHRAGIGVTEAISVTAIIVSEENGIISIAQSGKISRYADSEKLRQTLHEYFWQSRSEELGVKEN